MQVSIVIVTYNDYQNTCNCLRSIIEQTKKLEYEIILVDNASPFVRPDIYKQLFPQITLIRNPENNGFAKGCNLGIQQATGQYILLLNNDTILHENSIKECYNYMCYDGQIGVLGCRMVYPNGEVQYTARNFKSIWWELLDMFRFIPKIIPYDLRSWLMMGRYFKHDQTVECDWVMGAFFMFPAYLILYMDEQKLDDRFFMSAEDQLWCWQIKKMDYKVVFFSNTTITHINGASNTSKLKALRFRDRMLKNELAVMKERKGNGWYYRSFALIYILKEGSRTLIKKIILKLTGKFIR